MIEFRTVLFVTSSVIALFSVTAAGEPLSFDNTMNYGAPNAHEQAALDAINAFRSDPRSELYEIFVGMGFGGTRSAFDSLLASQTSYTPNSNWWRTQFGSNLVTGSMDFFRTVPSTLKAQFDVLAPGGSLSPLAWSDNIGWSAHQYAIWIEEDAGASNSHAIPGAPSLGNRFTNAGVNWTVAAENVGRDWPLNTSQMHAGFTIDWGVGVDGIQSPPGHRDNILSTSVSHIGIGISDHGWTPGNITQVQHIAAQYGTDDIFYGYVRGAFGNGVFVEVFDAVGSSLGTANTDEKGAYTIMVPSGVPAYAEYTNDIGTFTTNGLIALGSSGSNFFLDAVLPDLLPPDPTPPTIDRVFLGGSGWTASYLNAVGNLNGVPIDSNSNNGQGNADKVLIDFDRNMNIADMTVVLSGLNQGSVSIAGLNVVPGDASLVEVMLNGPLGGDQYNLQIDNATATDGTTLDTFAFPFNMLPGDYNGDGTTFSADLSKVGAAWGTSPGTVAYDWKADGNGDGFVFSSDFSLVSQHWTQSNAARITPVPVPEPSPHILLLTAVGIFGMRSPFALNRRSAFASAWMATPRVPRH